MGDRAVKLSVTYLMLSGVEIETEIQDFTDEEHEELVRAVKTMVDKPDEGDRWTHFWVDRHRDAAHCLRPEHVSGIRVNYHEEE